MSPFVRQLYELAEHEHPQVYEMLRDLDAQLAELHHAGMEIQRARLQMLKTLASARPSTTAINSRSGL